MKFIEFGIGNTWLLRTETECEDGSEYEERGIVGPVRIQSLYIRIWIGKAVWIFDTRQGIHTRNFYPNTCDIALPRLKNYLIRINELFTYPITLISEKVR